MQCLEGIQVTNDEKKRYLWQYQISKRRVVLLQEQIDALRDDQTSPVAIRDGMPHSSTIFDLSTYAAQLDTLQRKQKKEMELQIVLYQDILQYINQLSNVAEKDVLIRRYLIGQRLEKIAAEMGYSYRHIVRLHGQALKNFSL